MTQKKITDQYHHYEWFLTFNILYNNYHEIKANILVARAVPILLIIS